MKIYLIQPGENDSNNLTSNGVLQIKSLARKILSERIDVNKIYVNGSNISKQTGELLSKMLEIPIFSDERFVEIGKDIILGKFNNLDLENLDNLNLFIDEIVHKNKDVIITIGGGIHRLIISKLTGMPLVETRHFYFQNSGVSILHYDNGTAKWRISSVNDVNHLRIP